MTSYAEVILPLPLEQTFTYAIPEELAPAIQPGIRVVVPFRARIITGFVLRVKGEIPEGLKLVKNILFGLDQKPLFSSAFLEFIRELSRVSFTPMGEILKAALPPEFLVQERGWYKLVQEPSEEEIKLRFRKRWKEVQEILRLLSGNKKRSWRFLQRQIDSPHLALLLRRLEEMGWLSQEKKIFLPRRKRMTSVSTEPLQLSLDFPLEPDFQSLLTQVENCLERDEFRPFLFVGPRARREAFFLALLRKWGGSIRNWLFLVPEIASSSSFLEKVIKIVGSQRVALLYGELSPKKREAEWSRIFQGEADIVTGARSAIFAPLPKVKFIFITEESDEAYVHPSPRYDAREAAWLRAEEDKAILFIGSSAPSVSIYNQAKQGGFLFFLNDNPKPSRIVSFPSVGPKILSPDLQRAISKCLSKKEKTVILINRRGYASILICLRCGSLALCPKCSRPLTLYLSKAKLVCHQCGFEELPWRKCRGCGSSMLESRGLGLEAVEQEIRHLWPRARVKSFEAEKVRTKAQIDRFRKDLKGGTLDIFIGTQFLLPWVNWEEISLAALLNPEMILAHPDFRSGERAFYLIRRVQEEIDRNQGAELLIQTAAPDNYVLQAAARGNYVQFAATELRFRRWLGLPPWMVLARLTLSGQNSRSLARQGREIKSKLETSSRIQEILGPSMVAITKKKYQIQIWVKGKKKEIIINLLLSSLKGIRAKPLIEIFS